MWASSCADLLVRALALRHPDLGRVELQLVVPTQRLRQHVRDDLGLVLIVHTPARLAAVVDGARVLVLLVALLVRGPERMREKTAFCTLCVLSFDEDAEVEGETSFERSMSFLPVDLAFFVMVLLANLRCGKQQQQGGEGVQPCQQAREAGEWPVPHGS